MSADSEPAGLCLFGPRPEDQGGFGGDAAVIATTPRMCCTMSQQAELHRRNQDPTSRRPAWSCSLYQTSKNVY